MYALRPTATGPGRSRAAYAASPGRARCDAPAAHAESPRRNRDPRGHSPAAAAVARVRPAAGESHPQRQGFLRVVLVRAGQAHGERHASPVTNQMARAPALGPINRIRPVLVTAAHCPPPPVTNQSDRRARANPAAQSGSEHPSSSESICQGTSLRRTKTMSGETRTVRNARPPCGRRGGIGKSGSTISHNASRSSATAIRVHATSPRRIRFRRFCYTL